MKKQELVMLIETIYDLANHGYKFSQRSDDELREKYNLKYSDSTYAFRTGWLENDIQDIVKVIESSNFIIGGDNL